MARLPTDEPAIAVAEEGEVLIDGPEGFVVSFTPRAAYLSAVAIAEAAEVAAQQAPSFDTEKSQSPAPQIRHRQYPQR